MADNITIKAGDTEPLTMSVSASGLSDLTGASSVAMYAREDGALTNHVDGAACSIPDTAQLEVVFDPSGAEIGGGDAFDAAGVYKCYLLITWSDGDTTRHPGAGHITVTAEENWE